MEEVWNAIANSLPNVRMRTTPEWESIFSREAREKLQRDVEGRKANCVSWYFHKPTHVDAQSVRMMAANGIPLNDIRCPHTRMKMIHVACLYGNYAIVKVLLEECFVDVNARASILFVGMERPQIVTPCVLFLAYIYEKLRFQQTPRESDFRLASLLEESIAITAYPGVDRCPFLLSNFAEESYLPLIRLVARAHFRFKTIHDLPLDSLEGMDIVIRSGVDLREFACNMNLGRFMVLNNLSNEMLLLFWYAGVPSFYLPRREYYTNCSVPPLHAMCISRVYLSRMGRSFLPSMVFRWLHPDLITLLGDRELEIPWSHRL